MEAIGIAADYIKEKHPNCTTLTSAKKYVNEWLEWRTNYYKNYSGGRVFWRNITIQNYNGLISYYWIGTNNRSTISYGIKEYEVYSLLELNWSICRYLCKYIAC